MAIDKSVFRWPFGHQYDSRIKDVSAINHKTMNLTGNETREELLELKGVIDQYQQYGKDWLCQRLIINAIIALVAVAIFVGAYFLYIHYNKPTE